MSCSKAPNKGVMSEGSRLCPGHQEPAHWAQGSFSLGRHLIGEQSGREIWHSGVRRMQGFSPFGQRSHSCFLPGPWSSPHPSHCRPRCTPHPASPASPSLTQIPWQASATSPQLPAFDPSGPGPSHPSSRGRRQPPPLHPPSLKSRLCIAFLIFAKHKKKNP